MPEILRRGVTESGIPWTIERDTPADERIVPQITFDEFVAMYPLSAEKAEATLDEFARGFFLHTRCPDGLGCFGPEAEESSWCEPADWHRLYYERRKAKTSRYFA